MVEGQRVLSGASFARALTVGASGVAQVVKCLFSKCEALSSNPSTKKKDKSTNPIHEGGAQIYIGC
jgi:hypothetical protein